MRRFAFRLEFKPLAFNQRLEMLASLCGESSINSLVAIDFLQKQADLTAGDFANVTRRLLALSDTIPMEGFLADLAVEASLKRGSTLRKIGFI